MPNPPIPSLQAMHLPKLLEFIASEEFAPAILSSEDIACLAFQPNGKGLRKMGFGHDLFGETLLRHWLYHGNLPEPLAELYARPELDEIRAKYDRINSEGSPEESYADVCPRAFDYFEKRKGDFDRAHGIIPLWYEHVDEAIPVPFTCEEGGMLPGIWDACGHQPQPWQDYLNELDLAPHIRCIRLQVPLGRFAQDVCGRSLM